MHNLGKVYARKKVVDDKLDYLFSCNINKSRLKELEEALFEITNENYIAKMKKILSTGGENMATRRWQMNMRNKQFIEEGIIIYQTLVQGI